jgi:hypothetical protein
MNKILGRYSGKGMWNEVMADALSDYFLEHGKELEGKWLEIWVSSTIYKNAPTGHLNFEVKKIIGQLKEFLVNDYIRNGDGFSEVVIDRDIVVKHYSYVKGDRGRVEGESLYHIPLNNIYHIMLTNRQEPVGLVENVDGVYGRTSYKPLVDARNWGEAWLKKEIESLKATIELKEESLKRITKESE